MEEYVIGSLLHVSLIAVIGGCCLWFLVLS